MTSELHPADAVDLLLADRLRRALDQHPNPDWLDVRRRASAHRALPARRRSTTVLIAAVLLVAIVAAPAFAFRSQIIDFFSAKPAPKSIVVQFGQLETLESESVVPAAFPSQARRVTDSKIAGKTHVLYVAPTKSGGFCKFWSGVGATCVPSPQARARRESAPLGFGYDRNLSYLDGIVLARGTTVKIVYADGSSTVIPYVWVTRPIGAGFFLFETPSDRRRGKKRAIAVVVSRDGRQLEHAELLKPGASAPVMVNHTDPWGRQIQTPTEAIWEKRRLLFNFLARNGEGITLFVMPSRQGSHRHCFTSPTTGTCETTPLAGPPLQLQLLGGGNAGGGNVLLSGEVTNQVKTVELRYQDGTRERIKPRQGFVLAEIEQAHYKLGHRLTNAIGYDRRGRIVARNSYKPAKPNIYPCTRPKNYGYGVNQCP